MYLIYIPPGYIPPGYISLGYISTFAVVVSFNSIRSLSFRTSLSTILFFLLILLLLGSFFFLLFIFLLFNLSFPIVFVFLFPIFLPPILFSLSSLIPIIILLESFILQFLSYSSTCYYSFFSPLFMLRNHLPSVV